jgi:hypothetical protein
MRRLIKKTKVTNKENYFVLFVQKYLERIKQKTSPKSHRKYAKIIKQ